VNVQATILALETCLDQIDFAECLFFTDAKIAPRDKRIRVVPIPRIASARAYSNFLLSKLVDFVESEHCLVIQWDGFVLDGKQWDPRFLSCDYIGAPWPQFTDGHDVGNGGFSLRSRKLLQACRDPQFLTGHPEDVAICRTNRALLESTHGIRFADAATAGAFSFERTAPTAPTFGFHGIFNMIPALGPERFWRTYRTLDDRHTAFVDYGLLMHQLGHGRRTLRRRSRLTFDVLAKQISKPRASRLLVP
jgi:hypothetical protein